MQMKHLTISLLLLTLLAACRKDDDPGNVDNIPGLGGDSWVKGPIDKWIEDSLTTTFNMTVKYKWEQGELDFTKVLVPPREDKIIPILSTIRRGWIKPFVEEAGELFMKRYSPKYYIMVGSPSFNMDGTITLGTAEGGRTIELFALNDFRVNWMPGYVPSDSDNVKQMFHVIEHEFGHILNQTVAYNPDYKRISVGKYTANWVNYNDEEARRRGFVTGYSMSGPDEDFVEMVAVMLMEGRAGFDRMVNDITEPGGDGTQPAAARAILRQKEAMVVEYYKNSWGINFYNLQIRTRAALVALIK